MSWRGRPGHRWCRRNVACRFRELLDCLDQHTESSQSRDRFYVPFRTAELDWYVRFSGACGSEGGGRGIVNVCYCRRVRVRSDRQSDLSVCMYSRSGGGGGDLPGISSVSTGDACETPFSMPRQSPSVVSKVFAVVSCSLEMTRLLVQIPSWGRCGGLSVGCLRKHQKADNCIE